MDKSRRRTLRDEIRAVATVLRRHRDPISGGAEDGVPVDEYDSYAPPIVGMIERGESDRALAEHLSRLEAEVIGVGHHDPPPSQR